LYGGRGGIVLDMTLSSLRIRMLVSSAIVIPEPVTNKKTGDSEESPPGFHNPEEEKKKSPPGDVK